jgi:hypothetical protein
VNQYFTLSKGDSLISGQALSVHSRRVVHIWEDWTTLAPAVIRQP